MSLDPVDTIVIGAGVVGIAIARALSLAGHETIVLEAAGAIGTHTSSRNSEVIHAGIYYPKDSMKARLCVAGRDQLYAYCQDHAIPHRNCGKLIVATSQGEIPKLTGLQAKARANGVDDLRLISAEEARDMEPQLQCVAALVSPSTGIIDSHAYMLAMQGEAETHGAVFAFNAPVTGAQHHPDGIEIRTGGEAPYALLARHVVNAAGLWAQPIARTIIGLPPVTIPPRLFAKGSYFTLAGRAPFTRLIYPLAESGSLGIHFCVDIAGQARFGPDIEGVDGDEYQVDPARGEVIYDPSRPDWPALPAGALMPGYAGIRPKLVPQGQASQDFVIQGPVEHGIPGLINL
ncbi:MAG: NAD(P)/FAD-dependent oxidoreductase, partial [Alphaproteobacteria bacterium]